MSTDAQTAAPPNDFAILRKMIVEKGLLERNLGFFVWKIVLNTTMLAIGIAVLFLTKNLFLLLLDAVYLAFVYGQIGLLGHDAGHRQIFSSTFKNDLVGHPCGLALGISMHAWMDKHNEHHVHPNREDMDPDIEFPIIAFSERQARDKKGLAGFCVRQQGWLFPWLLPFVAGSLRYSAFHYVFTRPIKKVWVDAVLLFTHFVAYFTLLFLLLPPLHAVLFILVHQGCFGFYMALIFAPNHKGMVMLGKDEKMDFLREQVLTARNVRGGVLADFWYGGLNYQVEHHLFPTMPRNKLRKANSIVRQFCKDKGIPYHETGVIESYVEIMGHMGRIAKYARTLA